MLVCLVFVCFFVHLFCVSLFRVHFFGDSIFGSSWLRVSWLGVRLFGVCYFDLLFVFLFVCSYVLFGPLRALLLERSRLVSILGLSGDLWWVYVMCDGYGRF